MSPFFFFRNRTAKTNLVCFSGSLNLRSLNFERSVDICRAVSECKAFNSFETKKKFNYQLRKINRMKLITLLRPFELCSAISLADCSCLRASLSKEFCLSADLSLFSK